MYTNVTVGVLVLALLLLGAEVVHTKWCDYCQRRDVHRSWLMCIRSVHASYWGASVLPTQRILALAEEEFIRLNGIRKAMGRNYLPRHLSGTPASTLIDRHKALAA